MNNNRKKLIGLVYLALLVLSGCKTDDCENIFPVIQLFSFEIVNEAGDNLIGSENVYQFENFRLFNNDSEVEIELIDSQVKFEISQINSNEDYFFELDNTDTDTLKIIHESRRGECFSLQYINNVFHNGVEIEVRNEAFFTLVK